MKHFCIKCGTELKEEQLLCPKCGHCSFFDLTKDSVKDVSGILNAVEIESNTQWAKYKCGKNASTGHGFAAEDANALNEWLSGYDVDQIGRNNTNAGPDRISNAQEIQTKYYKTANESVQAGFGNDGMYVYKGQILEVPNDQYEEAVVFMEEKIRQGKVEGIANPEDAKKIIKQGDVTYQQAKNIARAGNIDSLIFDAKTQTVTAISAFGISFAINLGMMCLFRDKGNLNIKEAMQLAFLSGLQNGTIAMTSGILTSQVLKTQFGRNLAAYVQWGAKSSIDAVYKVQIGKELIHNLSKSLWDKGIYGRASKQVATKFIRTNVITNLGVFVITSIPDTFFVIRGEISKPQFIKNLVVNGTSLAGGTLGAWLGACLGPYGMIGGGLAGGVIFNWTSKKIADSISKDDSEKMYELIKVALLHLSHDYMIQSEDEFQKCIEFIHQEKAIDTTFIRAMYSIGCDDDNDFLRVQIAYEKLAYYFYAVIRQRKTVCLTNNQEKVLDAINELGAKIQSDNDKNEGIEV